MVSPQKKQTAAAATVALVGLALTGALVGRLNTPPVTATGAVNTYAIGVLPNPLKTPGVANPAVTDATIATTIAVPGWTATVRPPAEYTDKLKREQLADGYAVDGDMRMADYEEDHAWALTDAGNPTDERNLRPMLYHIDVNGEDMGAIEKDRLERALNKQIVAHKITIAEAGRILCGDWPAGFRVYVNPKFPPYDPNWRAKIHGRVKSE